MKREDDGSIITRLKDHGIHITKTRIVVLRTLLEQNTALSVFDINRLLSFSLERASIHRVCKDFLQKKILLKVPDFNGE